MADLAQGWINHLRRQARNDQATPNDSRAVGHKAAPSPSFPVDGTSPCGEPVPEDVTPARKRLKSPTTSVNANRHRSPSPQRRSRSHRQDSDFPPDFPARPTARTKGRLWNEGDPIPTRTRGVRPLPTDTQHRGSSRSSDPLKAEEDPDHSLDKPIGQPETRPISQEQLVAEVKGIYAGLVMVESKCIEVDSSQSTQAELETRPKLNDEQWQALIALHRTLLHEHHDFFLASQHPSASPALRRLASKYAMPARMWRHGIHSFLELLRHKLPTSLEHMLTFIYLAYSMMALLYETVPTFEDTWIECLGDLGRYRMAIEDEDIRDRKIWTEVSRHWYAKASDKSPTTGRLYHHFHRGASVPDPESTEFRHDYNVQSMEFPQTARPLPEDWSLRGLLWADSLFPDDWFSSDNDNDDEGMFGLPSLLKGTYGGVSWRTSGGGLCSSPGFYSEPFDNLQSKCHSDGRTMPQCILNPLYLLSTIPQKFFGLAVLTAMAIPVVSAQVPGRDVVTMAWAFGIMANVPSVYVLANPPVPSRVEGGAEEVLWKIARGWGLTLGPVFAAILVVLLRTILPRGKRVAFIALVFAMSLVVMLLLKLFMRDDTWSVLDLLALCVSFCGVAAYIITSEPRGRNPADEDHGLEGGRPRYPQANLAINQPDQPPQVPRPEDDPDDGSAVQPPIRNDDLFVIGDDSTLGDGNSRT